MTANQFGEYSLFPGIDHARFPGGRPRLTTPCALDTRPSYQELEIARLNHSMASIYARQAYPDDAHPSLPPHDDNASKVVVHETEGHSNVSRPPPPSRLNTLSMCVDPETIHAHIRSPSGQYYSPAEYAAHPDRPLSMRERQDAIIKKTQAMRAASGLSTEMTGNNETATKTTAVGEGARAEKAEEKQTEKDEKEKKAKLERARKIAVKEEKKARGGGGCFCQ